jgi:UDP-3-O-[3-hydroxymyristoyl] glucosamine N-acyltransferase
MDRRLRGDKVMAMILAQIAQELEGRVVGDPQKKISGVAPFETATADDITYAVGANFLNRLAQSQAGAVIVPSEFNLAGKNLVQVANPELAFAKIIDVFHEWIGPPPGIHPQASIGAGFTCGEACHIGACAVIQDKVRLGDRVVIHPHVAIGEGVEIGDEVEIFPNVTVLERCRIGHRVKIHSGTVIGSDGFGYAADGQRYYKIKHLGIVQIDDDVEIGACNTIDRAKFGKTWIKRGVKTDNLVHIAHNVIVGEDSVLVAQVGIAGSTTIGRHAVIAGQAGIGGHITLGDNVIIGGQAGIAKSVTDGEVLSGTPGMPHRLWLRVQRLVPQLPEWRKKLAQLEQRLRQIEEKQDEKS